MKKIILIISVISIFPLCSIAQNQKIDPEENFLKLRKELIGAVVGHPRYSSFMKYIAYSFEIRFGEEIEINFSETTPNSIIYRSERSNNNGENLLKKRIKEFIRGEGMIFEKDQVVIYSVLHIWMDRVERDDNLEEAIEQLYDEGKNYINLSKVRVEKPIVTRLMGRME